MRRGLPLLVLIAFGAGAACSATAQELERALSVGREVERLAGQRVFWPGWNPLAIPLAVYTGENTYLFRHPSPPAGFSRLEGAGANVFVMDGRHPEVTSNTSADIGGTATATLVADGERAARSATELAAVALHEAFHVDQRKRHPGWAGNEADIFRYPTEDARLLGLRRLESAALRRALGAADPAGAACWARLALGYRRERFAGMEPAFPAYERLTELNEGLATYIQLIAEGKTTIEIPAAEFPSTEFRARIYTVGPALAFLLDRLRPGWQSALEADDKQFLDQVLESALSGEPQKGAAPCALGADEAAEIQRTAQADAAAVITVRGERRKAFDARPGWRVVIQAAEGQPLWPQGFDPLNVERVEGGVLHTRFLKLGNDAGELQAIDEAGVDIEALTEGAGAHPLFNGVRRVFATGFAKPEIRTEGEQVIVSTPGFKAQFRKAGVQVNGTEVLVRLEAR
ncbi:MAG TPA: hypothetical protein VLQ45_30180 [Thermoanaerobaculia bacterium]|nr:hypothetical protein [Thermoanaerobaculia bacterium]